ncbi:tryptophan synthase beta chain 2 [Striga asiatica]|uniref:Tryptophan synthase beta chain 2 n=1 Tax=Striga asiatica TaxID=4170 RepID=A0A5A7PIY0_STRAF|nr:tryptophan synthase beta chain 2 [Striga asiatica]
MTLQCIEQPQTVRQLTPFATFLVIRTWRRNSTGNSPQQLTCCLKSCKKLLEGPMHIKFVDHRSITCSPPRHLTDSDTSTPVELVYPEKPRESRKTFARAVPIAFEAELKGPVSVLRRVGDVKPFTSAVKKEHMVEASLFRISTATISGLLVFIPWEGAFALDVPDSVSICKASKCLPAALPP